MRTRTRSTIAAAAAALTLGVFAHVASAQQPEPGTREAEIASQQAQKAKSLTPYKPTKGETIVIKGQQFMENAFLNWHPFFGSAYQGGGFSPGIGYLFHPSAFNSLDIRASYSIRQYKRVEAEFVAPHLFSRRAELQILGGWREATQVGFYGFGNDSDKANRTNYGFQQPFASALFTLRPTRKVLTLQGGAEWAQWNTQRGAGTRPSIETRYSAAELPGFGADVKYLHAQGTVAIDSRVSPGYARRGTYLGVTAHEYFDQDDNYGFRQMDYDAVQHIPILREAWVLSLHGHLSQTDAKSGQAVPYFMQPWLGGGSTLRGYTSFRFRDRNSLLLQAEWRIMANRFMETAVFYDTGKVAAKVRDLDTKDLAKSYGLGFRIHSPFNTAIRIDLAKSTEGLVVVFATGAIF